MSGPVAAPARVTRRRVIRVLQAALSAAVVLLIFWRVLPQVADYSSVWAQIRRLTGLQVLELVAATLFNLFTYWPIQVASMPRLTLAQAAVNNQSSTSIANTVPGGGVLAVGVSYAMYRSWGFSGSEIALSTLLTGIWNSFIKLAMPIVAVTILCFPAATRRPCWCRP